MMMMMKISMKSITYLSMLQKLLKSNCLRHTVQFTIGYHFFKIEFRIFHTIYILRCACVFSL